MNRTIIFQLLGGAAGVCAGRFLLDYLRYLIKRHASNGAAQDR